MKKQILNKVMKENKLDAIISTSAFTRLWFLGIDATAGYLYITPKKADYIVDSRYIEIAEKTITNANVHLLTKENKEKLENKKWKRIGVEMENMTVGELERFKAIFTNSTFVPVFAQEWRIIKDKDDIKHTQKSVNIALKALKELEPFMKPGITEKELAAKLLYNLSINGSEKPSFDPIVASGPNGSMPHAKPTNRKLKSGDLLTIDFGATWKGFTSDITRTFHIGKVTNKKLIEIDKVLREAQKIGIKAVKPGIPVGDVDKACRDYITEKGFGKFFVHSTGHGMGVDVHELPVVGVGAKTILKPGMIITVEPGIYLPGIGGIRVEDDVLVTEKGHKVLSK